MCLFSLKLVQRNMLWRSQKSSQYDFFEDKRSLFLKAKTYYAPSLFYEFTAFTENMVLLYSLLLHECLERGKSLVVTQKASLTQGIEWPFIDLKKLSDEEIFLRGDAEEGILDPKEFWRFLVKIFRGNSSRKYILEKISLKNRSGYILKDFDGNPRVTLYKMLVGAVYFICA